MRTIVIGEETIEPNGISRTLEYSVLIGSLYSESGRLVGENYGVRVRLTPELPAEGGRRFTRAECEHVCDLTTKPDEIFQFVNKLRRGKVTPAALREVVADSLPL